MRIIWFFYKCDAEETVTLVPVLTLKKIDHTDNQQFSIQLHDNEI